MSKNGNQPDSPGSACNAFLSGQWWKEHTKPCPFCGTPADNGLDCWTEHRDLEIAERIDPECTLRFVMRCESCDCEMPGKWVPPVNHVDSLADLINDWNKRSG